uniref:Phosphoenolpyruvate carboxykinase GTP-utilising N-terminal domain-containing protein n=1 Tax=Ditylenchus dipsaci TaxID=166011 RepID=A0A915DC08_9BILA
MYPTAVSNCNCIQLRYPTATVSNCGIQLQMYPTALKRFTGSGSCVFARSDPDYTKHIGKCMVITTKKRSTTESGGKAEKKLTNRMSAYRFRLYLASGFPGCMRGRVILIVPFSMGLIGS